MISHDVFVVLAGVLKPILDHRDITKSEMGEKVRDGCAVGGLRVHCADNSSHITRHA